VTPPRVLRILEPYLGAPGARVATALRTALRTLWRSLRQWSGDAAYETYLARAGAGAPLDAKAFYLDSLRRRYRGQPDRCC
jgi:hypothetical protein